MHVVVNVKCMHTNFGRCGLSGFGDKVSFQIQPKFPFGPWELATEWVGIMTYTYVPPPSGIHVPGMHVCMCSVYDNPANMFGG